SGIFKQVKIKYTGLKGKQPVVSRSGDNKKMSCLPFKSVIFKTAGVLRRCVAERIVVMHGAAAFSVFDIVQRSLGKGGKTVAGVLEDKPAEQGIGGGIISRSGRCQRFNHRIPSRQRVLL